MVLYEWCALLWEPRIVAPTNLNGLAAQPQMMNNDRPKVMTYKDGPLDSMLRSTIASSEAPFANW